MGTTCAPRLALPLALALIVTACGGSAPAGRASNPSTTQPAAAARRQPAYTPPRAGPVADRLNRGLLTIGDLPAGWKLSQEARGDPDDISLCGAALATLEGHRDKLAEVDVAFERGTVGPFIVHALAAYPSGLAQRALDQLAATVQTCGDLDSVDEEGTHVHWQLSPIPFPPLGDQTVAFREYEPTNQVEVIVVYIRRGDLVSVLLDIAIRASVDRGQTEALARRADEKLAAIAGGR